MVCVSNSDFSKVVNPIKSALTEKLISLHRVMSKNGDVSLDIGKDMSLKKWQLENNGQKTLSTTEF